MIIYNSENANMHVYYLSIYVSLYMYVCMEEAIVTKGLPFLKTATSNKEGEACYVKKK